MHQTASLVVLKVKDNTWGLSNLSMLQLTWKNLPSAFFIAVNRAAVGTLYFTAVIFQQNKC